MLEKNGENYMETVNIGIIGCGNISDIYFENLCNTFMQTKIIACCDLDETRAKEKATKWNIPHVLTLDQMLECEDVQIILNLTPPQAHYALNKKILLANKHVYVEKPLALSLEEGIELVNIANEKGLFLCGAPDTFLGAGIQTARKLLDEGMIGDIVAGGAFCISHGFEGKLFNHPDNSFHYKPHVGPVGDVGVYYLTALIALLGPIKVIKSVSTRGVPVRTSTSPFRYGSKIKVEVDTHVTSLIQFHSGVIVTMISTFEAWASMLPTIEIYGTKGSMNVPDPNFYGNLYPLPWENGFKPLRVAVDNGHGQKEYPLKWNEIPFQFLYADNHRGLGIADMARCILEGGRPRAGAEFICHVMEAMLAMSDGIPEYKMRTTCERPNLMNPDVLYGLT